VIDSDEAIWLADLFLEAIANLDDKPGITIEVEGNPNHWVQVVFEPNEVDLSLAGFTLNFPFRKRSGDPLRALENAGLVLPPGSRAVEWEDDAFASIWLRPDVPIVALAHFVGDILERIVGANPTAMITAQIEFGF
jgi:hypothetical protein